MLDTFKSLVTNQYEAVFCTLHLCVDHCPSRMWQQSVANNPYSQSVFHTLFFADLYLGKNRDEQPTQEFHTRNKAVFSGYEQLEDQEPTETYKKTFIEAYLDHCRNKARTVVAMESMDELEEPADFPWLEIVRAEMHLYNIRHIQHHAAQLILKLRTETNCDMPWIKSGWRIP